ncbi:Nucleotide-binding universal stress protein, UspA family [Chitinophaga jiangningensis]|uniref:Nucleotide-binding universal stress protein, UspA family n=1 Tax=Chitinophaga jiangningensis TaxID=1419482 RepID=A0A1M6Z477_9BACT|nr:universal stress protein [Chitinophaga jiangningensis]SHL25324.1 Nucleotide-binding universal stress protein, UspA family [Chitinophaga jiangningensis]
MQTILALTDFSDTAFHAAEYASFLAKHYKTQQLILLNSYFLNPTALANQPVVAFSLPDIKEESEKLIAQWQTEMSVITGENTKVHGITSNLPINEVIEQLTAEEDVRCVVMGMKGKSNLEKVLVGSTAIRTMNSTNIPLLLIPADAPITIPKKIVLAVDLEIFQVAEKSQLTRVLDLFQAQILVINIAKNERYQTELRDEIQQLHELLDPYNVEYTYSTHRDVAKSISEFAQNNSADMIITIHRKNNSVLSFFQKSITQKLAWNSNIPLMVLPK